MMLSIALIEPEIPQNTGNIARLCAVTGMKLYLVGALGFSLDDKYLKRSGMDYWEQVDCTHIKDIGSFVDRYLVKRADQTYAFISTKGDKAYPEIDVVDNEPFMLIFGNETKGLPDHFYETYPGDMYRIPMKDDSRSLNLSNCVSIVSYHLLHTKGFCGLS